jgi:hypothetical protein
MSVIKFLFLIILYSCSQVSTKRPQTEELVSLDSALNHAMASYLKGCVDAYHDLKIPKVFETCRDKAKLHREEIWKRVEN